RAHLDLHSFPTRRSSDLGKDRRAVRKILQRRIVLTVRPAVAPTATYARSVGRAFSARRFSLYSWCVPNPRQRLRFVRNGFTKPRDRKSTRLNSSHDQISY